MDRNAAVSRTATTRDNEALRMEDQRGASLPAGCVRHTRGMVSSRAGQREAMMGWLSQVQFTHAITLAFNRERANLGMARRMFGEFCLGVDRLLTGKRRVGRLSSCERFEAIALPEHVESNLHLHVAANFHPRHWGGRHLTEGQESKLAAIWLAITKGSGDFDIRPARDGGWARYITKEWFRPDHDYLHSADFHPNDSVVSSIPALELEPFCAEKIQERRR